MVTINIERGHPTVDAAETRLGGELYRVRSTGAKYAKIIHGYGSSGTGGVIKSAMPRILRTYQSRRVVKSYIAGEDFGPYSAKAQEMASKYPELKKDPDWGRSNDGVTVVFF